MLGRYNDGKALHSQLVCCVLPRVAGCHCVVQDAAAEGPLSNLAGLSLRQDRGDIFIPTWAGGLDTRMLLPVTPLHFPWCAVPSAAASTTDQSSTPQGNLQCLSNHQTRVRDKRKPKHVVANSFSRSKLELGQRRRETERER